jgi:hypothetical protein
VRYRSGTQEIHPALGAKRVNSEHYEGERYFCK